MKGCARSGCVLVNAALAALLIGSARAYPGSVGCDRSLTSGTIMSNGIVRSGVTQVQLAKDGAAIACGGSLTAGDTGLTLVKASSGVGSQYLIEAVASANIAEASVLEWSSKRGGQRR